MGINMDEFINLLVAAFRSGECYMGAASQMQALRRALDELGKEYHEEGNHVRSGFFAECASAIEDVLKKP